ncbi:putative methyltransferase-domain-containing protein [Yarrowia lipolytica]|uniref:Putative methyltransferase-domain-containing protein n=1 Tax=Yarrowia lipolytica TaxID=4952 RepID=A0A371C1B2_YARLL|nr:putative methyltransferase-domain-containing protein [Yarrowia lipolytica]RDW43788.1 putative methyltransferase-domain-containing protein [Yarrowia lipolytica]RDW50526.1 putative methyltransferase-domain-containing protein [Yarrowia lipolytica]
MTEPDPPQLYTKPSADELITLLEKHSQNVIHNFESGVSNDPHNFYQWLTTLCASPLAWIEDEDQRDEIWQKAAQRIAERSGRTANPKMLRKIEIDTLPTISLVEPPLTGDFLGLKTWGSSFVLSQIFVSTPDLLKDTVLELGSGTGLCGIATSLLGHPIIATDLPEIVGNLETNFVENKIENFKTRTLDWTNPGSFLEDETTPNKYTTVVLADPVYSENHPPWIRDMLEQFLDRKSDSRAVICVPLRRKFDEVREQLWKLLDEAGFIRVRGGEVDDKDEFGHMVYTWGEWKWRDIV